MSPSFIKLAPLNKTYDVLYVNIESITAISPKRDGLKIWVKEIGLVETTHSLDEIMILIRGNQSKEKQSFFNKRNKQ